MIELRRRLPMATVVILLLAILAGLPACAETKTSETMAGTESTSTALTSSMNPSTYGTSVTFTATVTAASGTPTGVVAFNDDGDTLETVTLSSGQASCTTATLPVGSHMITAFYSGDARFAGSYSTIMQTVNGGQSNPDSSPVLVSFINGEEVSHIALDEEGNIYVGGHTVSPSEKGGSVRTAFVRKYSADGTEIWAHDLEKSGTPVVDLVVDGSGDVWVLCPSTMTKFTSSGIVLSTTRFDFPGGLNPDTRGLVIDKRVHIPTGETPISPSPTSVLTTSWPQALAVAVQGNAYVVGKVWASYDDYTLYGSDDAFLAEFDPTGNMLSYTLIGYTRTEPPHSMDEQSTADQATSVALDTLGRVYIAGYTEGDLADEPGIYTFLTKYGEGGSELWHEEIPSARCSSYPEVVILDEKEGVYLSGVVGAAQAGQSGNQFINFVSKYETTGTELWTRYPNTGEMVDLALDNAGCSYTTNGGLVRKYDATGAEVWNQDLEAFRIVSCKALEVDNPNDMYLLGQYREQDYTRTPCIARIVVD